MAEPVESKTRKNPPSADQFLPSDVRESIARSFFYAKRRKSLRTIAWQVRLRESVVEELIIDHHFRELERVAERAYQSGINGGAILHARPVERRSPLTKAA